MSYDNRFISFDVPRRTAVSSPLAPGIVCFHEENRILTYWQCQVCHDTWREAVPEGHTCIPPMDPKMAWVK